MFKKLIGFALFALFFSFSANATHLTDVMTRVTIFDGYNSAQCHVTKDELHFEVHNPQTVNEEGLAVIRIECFNALKTFLYENSVQQAIEHHAAE